MLDLNSIERSSLHDRRIRQRRSRPAHVPSHQSILSCWSLYVVLLVVVLCFPSFHFFAEGRSQKRCLYNILGVSKTCSPKELKKAYRKAALQAHPDKGGDEEEFKELSQAYQVLSDPQQRLRYDQYGYAGIQNGPSGGTATSDSTTSHFPFQAFQEGGAGSHTQFSFYTNNPNADFSNLFREFSADPRGNSFANSRTGGFGLEDWIRQMMGGRGGDATTRTPRPLKEVTRTLECTLADLFFGKTKKVTLQIQKGGRRDTETTPQHYTIRLKPGWKAGTKIKFPQRGNHVPPITFVIREAKHATLERRGNDLVYRHKVNTKQRKKSVRLSITLLDGQLWQRTIPADRVPQLLRPGQTLTVPNMGMPIKDTEERGNLIIEFY